MLIRISQRFQPFSHTYGNQFLLPGSNLVFKVYPACIEIEGVGQIDLPIEGPVKQFTTLLNLKKGSCTVFGHDQKGYFSTHIWIDFIMRTLHIGEKTFSIYSELFSDHPIEQLSFGCHKAQNWEEMHKRALLEEWLPQWHYLGQWQGNITHSIKDSADTLLGICQRADHNHLGASFMTLLQGAFTGYFVAEPERWKKLGLSHRPSSDLSQLIPQGAALIRHALIHLEDSVLSILPCLPRELSCGRYLHACFPWGTVDFEWSKRFIRRVILHCTRDTQIQLNFQKEVDHFRFRSDLKSRGIKLSSPLKLEIKQGTSYYFDQFEK